ncbi:MAG TPA: DUF1801 domain-containing protein [Chloroflexota bacterium]
MDPAVQAYIAAIPESKRSLFDRLQTVILGLYPDADILISYKIPTYKVGPKRVYLGLWKDGVSLHAVDVEQFKGQHPSIKTGRGSLNFKITDDLPEAAIRDVIQKTLGQQST